MLICDKVKCTGCGLCSDVCPQNCITIDFDENGFYQSYVDENNCIKCQKCVKLCPANFPNNYNKIFRAYKTQRKDTQNAIKSTSGGIAALVSEFFVSNKGKVVGCGFDDNLLLKHSVADNLFELEKFKGSKYIQSNTKGIYQSVKKLLDNAENVLFVGTPCQVSALCNFLSKPYDNLYTIDLACHGVSSQKVLNKHLKEIEFNNGKVIDIRFRNKDNGYKNGISNSMQYIFSDKIKCEPYNSCVGLWFASGVSLRESCYCCNFVSEMRTSDITLADYTGELKSEDEKMFGTSLMFINTEKGQRLFDNIMANVIFEEINRDLAVKMCTRIYHKTKIPKIRNAFFKDLDRLNIGELSNKYTLKKILPSKTMQYIIAIKRKFRIGNNR